jgi:Domain of unknown function (DUF3846)
MTMRNALVIKTDGNIHGIDLGENSHDEYEALSDAVGGMVQMVPLADSGLFLWCNEEGKLIRLPYNEKATKMWVKHWGQTDVMVGDCVITGRFDDKSELTMGLTPAQILLVSAVTDG